MTMSDPLPFNRPFIAGKELFYISHAVTRGHIGGDGFYTRKCASLLEQQFQIPRVLMTPSCTAALEMAAMLGDLGPGSEVILPSYTFVSTANAIVRLGAKPVFVDIRPDTLNLDPDLIAAAVTSHTRAIIAVHYAGVACDLDRILETAAEHGLSVIEDAAQGVNSFYKGRALGSIGRLGTYSFHETKNYISGEGGAICINDPALVDRAEIIRNKGTNRSQFMRGEVDKYTWVDVGSSYIPSEIACAFLYGQLEHLESIAARRQRIYELYERELRPLEESGLLRLPVVPGYCTSNHHMFYILLNDAQTRSELIDHLRGHRIQGVFHYVPLHSSPMGRRLAPETPSLPVTDGVSVRLLRLPFFHDITEDDQQRVVGHLTDFLRRRS